MPNELPELIVELEKLLGHPLSESSFLQVALTHRSYVNEMSEETLEDNERLEFLGDSVLDLIVSDWLMEKFPTEDEGTLSKFRSALVNERSLAQAARLLDLGHYVRLGRGEEMTLGREKDSILANAFEAVVAALYCSGGLKDAGAFVRHFLKDGIEGVETTYHRTDFKTSLQEFTQRTLKQTPNYMLVSEEGPDHEKTFESEVYVGERLCGKGRAKSKKDSEQSAAREALSLLQGKSGKKS
jgi:ribonuclease III